MSLKYEPSSFLGDAPGSFKLETDDNILLSKAVPSLTFFFFLFVTLKPRVE